MTRMERKMRRRNRILNLLIAIFTVVAILIAAQTLPEAKSARDMLKKAEATDRVAVEVMAEARATLTELRLERGKLSA